MERSRIAEGPELPQSCLWRKRGIAGSCVLEIAAHFCHCRGDTRLSIAKLAIARPCKASEPRERDVRARTPPARSRPEPRASPESSPRAPPPSVARKSPCKRREVARACIRRQPRPPVSRSQASTRPPGGRRSASSSTRRLGAAQSSAALPLCLEAAGSACSARLDGPSREGPQGQPGRKLLQVQANLVVALLPRNGVARKKRRTRSNWLRGRGGCMVAVLRPD